MLKLKRLKIPSTGKEVEIRYTAGGNAKLQNDFENS